MINYYLDIVAFAVVFVVFAFFRTKRRTKLESFHVFYLMLLTLVCYLMLESLTLFYVMDGDSIRRASDIIRHSVNAVYMIVKVFFITMFTMYLCSMMSVRNKVSRGWRFVVYLPLIPVMIVSVIASVYACNMGLGIMETRRLPMVLYTFYLSLAYYQLVTLWVGVRYAGVQEKHSVVHVMAANFVMALTMAVQQAFPYVRIAPFIASIGLLDILFTVLRPDEVFDNTEALKKVYLKRFAHEDLDHEIPFTLFLICVHDYNVIAESMGPQVADFFLRQVTLSLFDMNENISVFREEKNVLAVRMTNVSKRDAGNIKRHIEDRFRFPWRIATAETLLSADVLMVHCPDDIPDSKSFDTFLSRYDRLDPVKYATLSISDLLAQDRDEQMLTAIRRALKDDSFQVYYQPIYSTSEKKIVAAEALIRLFDPEYGFISPEDMIKLAEREGYILEIGEKVFRAVCRFCSENHPEKLGIEYIEVNLSAVQCAKSKLAEQFIKIMKEYGIESKRINFEVTETAAMVTDSAVISNIHYFEKNGVKLSLDDFGTGYSNISYLYNIPFSIMKVDKAILWSADKNRKADLTLKNTFMMASKLGIKVVQEGVETEEQIKKLLAIGCDYFQGFYFSKPVSGKDFLAYVRDFKLPAVCKGSEEGRNGNDK